jgi:[acyl-carrier-protein] S-malonyltransferase
MARASASLRDILSRLPLGTPQIPVVANVTATAMLTAEDVRQELAHHVERPVNWTRSVAEMVNSGATTFIEVGPGQVLSGLIRRINRDVTTLSLTDLGLPADVRNT